MRTRAQEQEKQKHRNTTTAYRRGHGSGALEQSHERMLLHCTTVLYSRKLHLEAGKEEEELEMQNEGSL